MIKEIEKRYFLGDKIAGSQQAIDELQAFILEQRMRLPEKLTAEDRNKVKDFEREMSEAKRKEELLQYYAKYEKIIEKYKLKK